MSVSLKNQSIARKLLISYSLGSILPLFIGSYFVLKHLFPGIPARENLFILAPATIVISVLSALLMRQIVRNVKKISSQAERIAGGELAQTLAIEENDETGLIASRLNEVARRIGQDMISLESRTIALEKAKKELEKANKKIENYNVELEKKVEERTKELRESNLNLIQAAKLVSTGYMAGGVVHELGNPIAGILNFAQLMGKKLNEQDPNMKYVKIIEQGALQCENVIKNFSSFVSRSKETYSSVDCNQVVENALSLIDRQMSYQGIKIVRKFASDLQQIQGNAEQLQQVFLNVISNAKDAMPDGGELTITTRTLDDMAIELEFKDTGSGLSEDTISRIFEPFFTTKGEKGVGLGLSISYNIVKEHRGDITVKSGDEAGAIFVVKLPLIQQIEQLPGSGNND